MSAFILNHSHIDALVDFARRQKLCGTMLTHELNELGQHLIEQNIKSVCYRYRENEGSYATEYRFCEPARRLSPVEIIKAAQCYDYQSCEHPGYEATRAAKLMASIRDEAISMLPGYVGAAWELPETHRKAA